jgi:hypothetical protein
MPPSSAAGWSMTAQLSSESWVHERRLKLSDPMMAHVSSTMHTLAWT